MTTSLTAAQNRLAKAAPERTSKLLASEWAAIARETGRDDAAKKWDERAAQLGEDRIPNGQTVRFKEDKSKHRVWIGSGLSVFGR